MTADSIKRARFLVILIIISASIIVGKLYFVQIVKGQEYSARADRQYVKPNVLSFDRGNIFFSTRDDIKIAAASVIDGYTLYLNPKLIKDAEQAYAAVSQYTTMDHDNFIQKATKKDDTYEEIQKRVEKSIGQKIAALKIPGVYVQKESWRVYPADRLASQTVGIIGYDKDSNLTGRYGLEAYYEKVLSRKNTSSSINFFAELFSGIKKSVFDDDVKGDVVTTIEPTVQSYLDNVIGAINIKWKSDMIGGIIMDPNTGEIYAMSNFPTFNPNDTSEIKDIKVFSNPMVENSYEMGSIVKALTVAAGIDSGAVDVNTTYDDKGFLILNGRKISNFDGKARGITSMQDVLSKSLNVGASFIAQKTGPEKFANYFLSFGIGSKTGIDQPSEQQGLVKNLTSRRDVEIATASYGQGIAMTPIQTIRALSVVANGGLLINPHIVKSLELVDGSVSEIQIPEAKRVLKKESTDDVTQMLINLVDKALKNGNVKMEHYSIAAKTGTAQIADPVNGGYYDDRYLHSFFGYFPAYEPKFIIFLYHLNPKGADFASETLTDPFMNLVKLLINYYEIPPDR